jgi:hypothetical protein
VVGGGGATRKLLSFMEYFLEDFLIEILAVLQEDRTKAKAFAQAKGLSRYLHPIYNLHFFFTDHQRSRRLVAQPMTWGHILIFL